MSPRCATILFGFVLSALMSLVVSGIATLRNAGLVDEFVSHWLVAWLPSRFDAFPNVVVVAPLARHLVGMLIKAQVAQVR